MSLFGTDGVRGLANVEPMTPETLLRLGRAVVALCADRSGRRPRIVIGRDTRLSGRMLEAALASGMASAGADVLLADEVPTPAVAFLTRSLGADAGAVISASHNRFDDNGVKLFAADGFKLAEADERRIEALLNDGAASVSVTGAAVGTIHSVVDAADRYAEFLQSRLSPEYRLDGMRLALDCANGAAYRIGPRVLEALGATVVALGIEPDGVNINEDGGAVHPQQLQATVRSHSADFGVALDGDADRSVFADETGALVDGDEALAILAADLQRRGALLGGVVVGTVMSNVGLEVALRQRGLGFVRAQVGDRYVVEEMRRHGANLGGEPSGHIVLLDQHTTGDGLLAALSVARIVRETGESLSSLRRIVRKLPQVLRNVRVGRRSRLEELPSVQVVVDRIVQALHGRGRVLVRVSGTEPVVRVMVEGEEQNEVEAFADEIAAVVKGALGSGDAT